MVTFRQILTSDAEYEFVERLFVQAFVDDERRDCDEQRKNIDSGKVQCLIVETLEGEAVGFVTYWAFPAFCYIEHFAIAGKHRGKGYGTQVITAFVEMMHCPVVLEVEHRSTGETARRRIDFYGRNGFELWAEDYFQPPYNARKRSLPMHLMVCNKGGAVFGEVRDALYASVYGVKLQ